MKRKNIYIILAMCLVILSGCLNPGNEKAQNHIAYQSDLTAVQEAVNAYRKDHNGLLPIKNSTEKTPIYKKYPIDFDKLAHYMANPPTNAYEEGGIFQYVLVDVETHPTVKVIDLTLTNKVEEIQMKINNFRAIHHFSPIKNIVMNGVYTIDYQDLGYERPPYVISPYSGKQLGFVIDNRSKVYINYLPDIYEAVKASGKAYQEGKDLRPLLVSKSAFVPVESLPYTLKNGQVTFLLNH